MHRKAAEGTLYVVKVLEEVEVILLNVQNDRHGGVEGEEGVIILTALHYNCIALADTVACL